MNSSHKILIINSGSTSVKFELFLITDKTETNFISSFSSSNFELIKSASGAIEWKGQNSHSQSKVQLSAFPKFDKGKKNREPIKVEFGGDPEIENTSDAFNCIIKILTSSSISNIIPNTNKSCDSWRYLDQSNVLPFVQNQSSIKIVGHRVVHGGPHFSKATVINQDVQDIIDSLSELAPLHNPPNLCGIQSAKQVFSDAYHMAVFDTAFHNSIPLYARMYPLPRDTVSKPFQIQRYGFHGTSHRYMARTTMEYLNLKSDDHRLVTIHLGNGASMAAIRNGRCIDTTMGFTPLEGLMMGTRSGSIDPAIVNYLLMKEKKKENNENNEKEGKNENKWTSEQINHMLNHKSGLKGICGTHDMRDILNKIENQDSIENQNDEEDHINLYRLAFDMYCYRIKKYLGSYLTILGGADAIIFSAGIGENVHQVREAVVGDEGMSRLFGIYLDSERNQKCFRSDNNYNNNTSPVIIGSRERKETERCTEIVVVPTDEGKAIAQECISEMRNKEKDI